MLGTNEFEVINGREWIDLVVTKRSRGDTVA